MPDAPDLAIILATFLIAGAVKGVIGLGLPTVSLGLLTAAFNLPTAMALLLVPSFVTNVWQAFAGGHAGAIVRRTWPFLFAATATVWIGGLAFSRIDRSLLSALLGALISGYAVVGLTGYRISIAGRAESWAGPIFGAINGVLAGMTGSFVVPGVMYLQAIGLPRDALVQAMGLLFTASTMALGLALGGNGLISQTHGILSAVAVVPALVGMVLGQRLRARLQEAVFRKVFFWSLLALGAYITFRAALA